MSEHVENAEKLLASLKAYPNAYVAKEKTAIATRAQAHATLAMVQELTGISEKLAAHDQVRVTREELDRLVCDSKALASANEGRNALIQELERAHDRCPGCDHYRHGHGTEGCTFVFSTTTKVAENMVSMDCPCTMTPNGADQ